MNKPIFDFFEKDHRRIEALLDKSVEQPDVIQMEFYQQFRIGLLTHIKMEEKILFPAAIKANNGTPLPVMARLRLEHGALTALMVPPPTRDLIKVLYHVIEQHDLVEEAPGGMYDVCEALTLHQTDEILALLHNTPEVPVHPHHEAAFALESAKRTLLRAGYDYEAIAQGL